MPSAQVDTTNGTSFSEIKAAYVNSGQTSASGNSSLNDGSTTSAISMSYFRNATFTNSTSVPSGSNAISLDSTFRFVIKGNTSGKTFEAGGGGDDY